MHLTQIENGVAIYLLIDPRDGEIRYCGKSKKPESRYKGHIAGAKRDTRMYSARWIATLLELGLVPELVILCWIPEQFWQKAECLCIAWLRENGHPLTNLCDGGFGGKGMKHTPESKAHLSRIFKGRVISEEQKAQISKTLTGRKHTDERRANESKSHMGKKQSVETIEKRVSKTRGKKRTPEMIAKQIESYALAIEKRNASGGLSAESRAKMSEAAKKRMTPEVREKIRQTLIRRNAEKNNVSTSEAYDGGLRPFETRTLT